MEAMGSLGELSIADIGRALGRYKPVAATVLAILLALAVLPAPDRPPGLASTGLGGAGIQTPQSTSASGTSPDDGATSAPPTTFDDGSAGGSFSPPVTSGTTSFPSFSSGSSFSGGSDSGSSSSPSDSSGDSEGGSSSSFGPITSGTSTADTTGSAAEPEPLRVVASAWASRTGGTPLAKDGVPAGTLPVGSRVEDDKLSYVKVSGEGTVLGFATDPAGARDVNGPAKVQACKVTEAWEDGGEGIPIQDRPNHDINRCVQGSVSATGAWVFDLSSFPNRTDDFGFALVPGEGAGLDWQVAFKR